MSRFQTNSFLETLRKLRRGRGIQICPKCGSPNIKNSSWLDGWVLPDRYLCPDCKYSGYLIMELEKEDEGEGKPP